MKTTAQIGKVLAAGTLVLFFAGCGGDSKQLQAENAALREELAELKARAAATEAARDNDAKRTQGDAQEVVRLRGEITQLRTSARDAEKLRAENQQLRTENQKLRGATATAATPAPQPPATPAPGTFPRDTWNFSGYASPEAALVSAIWSMQQGNPKQYFDSLTQDEQLRMAKAWEGKSQEEIVAKHQADTAKITGLKVLNQQAVSADEIQMSVYIEGVDRAEKVSMKRVGEEWRFGGFIRQPQ
jgi:hypothetical protein